MTNRLHPSLTVFLRPLNTGVCRTCRQRLKEIIDTEMHYSPVFGQMGVDSNITDQMERMTLVSIPRFP